MGNLETRTELSTSAIRFEIPEKLNSGSNQPRSAPAQLQTLRSSPESEVPMHQTLAEIRSQSSTEKVLISLHLPESTTPFDIQDWLKQKISQVNTVDAVGCTRTTKTLKTIQRWFTEFQRLPSRGGSFFAGFSDVNGKSCFYWRVLLNSEIEISQFQFYLDTRFHLGP